MTTLYRNRRTTVLSDMFVSFGGLTSIFAELAAARRRSLERERSVDFFTDLIENADDHILSDLGYTRADLFRMRAKLYE